MWVRYRSWRDRLSGFESCLYPGSPGQYGMGYRTHSGANSVQCVPSPLPVTASLGPTDSPRAWEGRKCHETNTSLPLSGSLQPTTLGINVMLNQ